MYLVETASTLRSSQCSWKAEGAEAVKCLVVAGQEKSLGLCSQGGLCPAVMGKSFWADTL